MITFVNDDTDSDDDEEEEDSKVMTTAMIRHDYNNSRNNNNKDIIYTNHVYNVQPHSQCLSSPQPKGSEGGENILRTRLYNDSMVY